MNGLYYEINGKNAQLTINNTESIFQHGGVKYRFINNILDSIKNKNGEFKLSRNSSGLVDKIYKNGASILDVDYDKNFLVAKISNRESVIEYAYENKKLMIVKNNNEISYSYKYSPDSALLTEILDGKGNLLAKWGYDTTGRAISSEHANGIDKFIIDYTKFDMTSVPEITVTNPLNKKTTYRYHFINGQRKIINIEGHPTDNCAASSKAYTYTPEGWVASKTDWKGIKTTFTYNTVGQEVSRTEAFGTPEARTITTEWHPTLFVKTKIIEPEKETVYTYDVNGRLLNQTVQSISAQ